MAIVAEYKFNNCTVAIHDDAVAGVSREEMDRRIREARRVAWRIAEAAARREHERSDDNGNGDLLPVREL